MSNQTAKVMVFTTRTWSHLILRAILLLLINSPGALGAVAVFTTSRPRAGSDLIPCAIILVLFFVLSLVTLRLIPSGTWTIAEDGIGYEPARGEPRRLRWQDVERVVWDVKYVVFRGG